MLREESTITATTVRGALRVSNVSVGLNRKRTRIAMTASLRHSMSASARRPTPVAAPSPVRRAEKWTQYA